MYYHVGLQSFIDHSPIWKNAWSSFIHEHVLPVKRIDINSMQMVTSTMLAATAGYPKIHSVWLYFCSFIIPLSHHQHHHHQSIRVNSLTSDQLSSLKTFVHFIDIHLIPHSIEKRCVAFHLLQWLITYLPYDCFIIALSIPIMQCLVSCRTIKKHPLHEVAGKQCMIL